MTRKFFAGVFIFFALPVLIFMFSGIVGCGQPISEKDTTISKTDFDALVAASQPISPRDTTVSREYLKQLMASAAKPKDPDTTIKK